MSPKIGVKKWLNGDINFKVMQQKYCEDPLQRRLTLCIFSTTPKQAKIRRAFDATYRAFSKDTGEIQINSANDIVND